MKWYDTDKGYGFVHEDNTDRDVFLHSGDIQEPEPKVLWEGHRVRFEVEDSDRGPRAIDVLVITGTEQIGDESAAAEPEAVEEAFDPHTYVEEDESQGADEPAADIAPADET